MILTLCDFEQAGTQVVAVWHINYQTKDANNNLTFQGRDSCDTHLQNALTYMYQNRGTLQAFQLERL